MGWDFGVIGSGIAGLAIAYELANRGATVLLVEDPAGLCATDWSYGGIAYWAAATPLSRQLCQESIQWHRQAANELGHGTGFRDRQILLWFGRRWDIQSELQKRYGNFAIAPEWLGIDDVMDREPQFNRGAIGGALAFPHGQVDPRTLRAAYRHALMARGGRVHAGLVTAIRSGVGNTIQLETDRGPIPVGQVVVAAGALSRTLLQQSQIPVPLYWSHAELVELAPSRQSLSTIVMPALQQRQTLESRVRQDDSWDQDLDIGHAMPILDAGAVQFSDRRIIIGQISRLIPQTQSPKDPQGAERQIRDSVGRILPTIASLPGQFQHCWVAFSLDGWPIVGELRPNIHLFTGFSSPFVYVPPFAQRLAQRLTGNPAPDKALILADPKRLIQNS
jgi:glycine/D-amino acid oxidase-like deaminating enzyme